MSNQINTFLCKKYCHLKDIIFSNKAAYCGLYGINASIIDKIEGDFFTVIGLPLLKLGKELENLVSWQYTTT